jgi:hypothetical protein
MVKRDLNSKCCGYSTPKFHYIVFPRNSGRVKANTISQQRDQVRKLSWVEQNRTEQAHSDPWAGAAATDLAGKPSIIHSGDEPRSAALIRDAATSGPCEDAPPLSGPRTGSDSLAPGPDLVAFFPRYDVGNASLCKLHNFTLFKNIFTYG